MSTGSDVGGFMSNKLIGVATVWAIAFVVLVGLIPSNYMPHAMCWRWDFPLITAMTASNAAIAASYATISLVLWRVDQKARLHNKHFIFVGFATFIWFCGLTHVMDIVTIWFPLFWLDIAIRWLCAIPSIIVAIYVFGLRKQIVLVLGYIRDNWEEVTRVLAVE